MIASAGGPQGECDWTFWRRSHPMAPRRDYSCEILALLVLTILSALSHFWYIMIGICIVMGFAGAAVLLSKIFLGAMSELGARISPSALREEMTPAAELSVDTAQGPRPSPPIVSIQLPSRSEAIPQTVRPVVGGNVANAWTTDFPASKYHRSGIGLSQYQLYSALRQCN